MLQPTADGTRGWPTPKPLWTLMACLGIALAGSFFVLTTIWERSVAPETALIVGGVTPEAAMTAKLVGGGLDRPEWRAAVAGDIHVVTEPWLEDSISMRLARVILLAANEDRAAALDGFVDCVNTVEEHDLLERAGPVLRVVASLLRGARDAGDLSGADGASDTVLDRWPEPSEEDRVDANKRLGPFILVGEALAEKNVAARESLRSIGTRAIVLTVAFAVWAGLAALGGLIAVVTLSSLAASGRLRNGTGAPQRATIVLLEVFAIYLLLAAAAGIAGGLVGELLADESGASATATMIQFGFLIASQVVVAGAALAWWRQRGGTWATLRSAAGLHVRDGVARTLGIGLLGYSLAVILAIGGFAITALLSWLIGAERFGNPSHPIYEVLAESGVAGTVIVILLGVVMAPVVEEIFFRGALYRALRDRIGTSPAAILAGAVGATLVSSAIFGAVHPQGLLFAPVLAGLGAGLCVVREWSGSVAPGIVAHALSNGVILGLSMLLFN